jgi:hypothetical protein
MDDDIDLYQTSMVQVGTIIALPLQIHCDDGSLAIPGWRGRSSSAIGTEGVVFVIMTDLYDYPLLATCLFSLTVILIASEIGYRIGARNEGQGSGSVSTLESALLGLLALMIGFTFAMALARFEARRDAVLNEANAIGTTALRARLLPEPHRTEALRLLREYVNVRLDVTQRQTSPTKPTAAIDRSNTLQEALWQQAKAVTAKDNGMVPTGLFIQTLNEMIDNHAKRLAAMRNRVPNIVLLALLCVAIAANAFAGYASGLDVRRKRLPVYVTGVLFVAVMLLLLDLDRPGAGFIDVSQQPMIDTAASIAAFTD